MRLSVYPVAPLDDDQLTVTSRPSAAAVSPLGVDGPAAGCGSLERVSTNAVTLPTTTSAATSATTIHLSADLDCVGVGCGPVCVGVDAAKARG